MCVGGSAPEMPSLPERQAAKLPDGGSTANNTDQQRARRRALMSTVLTSANGTIGAPATTGRGTATTLG